MRAACDVGLRCANPTYNPASVKWPCPENRGILYGVSFLVYDQVMIKVNISDAKAHFSRYLESVESGETILLCRRNVPIAEIRPVPKRPAQARPVGIDRGMVVPASFFEPLPDDLLDAFEGGEDPV